ncbi:MAG: nucleotidyl transferase AbiEii/AbiGii toxin family protein [Flavobacteriales bacterium]|nr:nucleotidyl transferase AbiEii/AbiGii toxin family protein [Flavobacteriales bacterium]
MLRTETVEPGTLELLRSLMRLPELEGFLLVGGTSLSLQIGHRISIDLDLFSTAKFDAEAVLDALREHYQVDIAEKGIKTLNLRVNDVKVDILHYPYPLLQAPVTVDGIRMIGRQDICAMKLSAISSRAAKKDFFDLFFLFREFQFAEMLDFYRQKFGTEDIFHVLKSVTYFVDADESPDPNCLENITWEQVKNGIKREVRRFV